MDVRGNCTACVVLDLVVDGIKLANGIDGIQTAGFPFFYLRQDSVGNVADCFSGKPSVELTLKVPTDLTGTCAKGIHAYKSGLPCPLQTPSHVCELSEGQNCRHGLEGSRQSPHRSGSILSSTSCRYGDCHSHGMIHSGEYPSHLLMRHSISAPTWSQCPLLSK